MFNTLDVDRFLLEYDDERSGSFEPLRFVPKGKTVVLGLITSKMPKIEDAPSSCSASTRPRSTCRSSGSRSSPQCGFASMLEGNVMTEDEQWAKLEARRRRRANGLEIIRFKRHRRGPVARSALASFVGLLFGWALLTFGSAAGAQTFPGLPFASPAPSGAAAFATAPIVVDGQVAVHDCGCAERAGPFTGTPSERAISAASSRRSSRPRVRAAARTRRTIRRRCAC